jgi:hypothetical protein
MRVLAFLDEEIAHANSKEIALILAVRIHGSKTGEDLQDLPLEERQGVSG